jgi:ribosomal protein S17E
MHMVPEPKRDSQPELAVLRTIFHDQPDLLEVVTAKDLESEQLLEVLRQRDDLYGTPVKQYVAGRTGAGKTSLGNRLFGADVMSSTGHINCTDYIGLLRMRSNLYYVDTPGAGSTEKYENWTRLALGLPQIDEDPADSLGVHDFTDARLTAAGKVEGEVSSRFTAPQWEAQLAGDFAPDVVVYVVASHMQFIRPDREFLTEMLRRYGARVLIALNDWTDVTTDIHRDDAASEIEKVYLKVFPDGLVRPRFTRVNALTGSGMSELTGQICRTVSPGKLGAMQQVLDKDLKKFAGLERSRRYHAIVNRIAARLALHTVDQKAGDQDLISVAAEGVCRYGVLTFEAGEQAAALREEMSGYLDDRVRAIQKERQEEIKVKEAQTSTRDITVQEPVIELVETESTERRQIAVQVQKATGVSLGRTIGAYVKAGWKHVDALGQGKAAHGQITRERQEATATSTTETVMQDVDVPVKKIEQQVTGYTTRVVDTVSEVTGVTERVVGTKALPGGMPVIELLTAVGLGIERYCTATGGRASAETFIAQARDQVRLILDRERRQLETLLQQGSAAEPAIIALLDRVLHDRALAP